MAQNNDNLSNFIDKGAWDDFAKLEKVIQSAADSLEYLSMVAQDAFKGLGGAGNLKDLIDFTNKAADANKKVGETVKTVKTGLKELNAEQLKSNISIKERNDLLKLQVAAEAAPAGSIAKVRAEAALLRKELMVLNLEKEKGRQEDIKAQLLVKDAFIKSNVDAYTAQKINIGNYPELIGQFHQLNKEMEALKSTGQQDSEEFSKLAGKIDQVKGSLTSLSGATGFTSGPNGGFFGTQLSSVTRQMQQLEVEGKKDTDVFRQLVAEAELLKHAMDGVSAESKETTKAVSGMHQSIKNFGANIAQLAATYLSFEALKSVITGSIEEFKQADEAADRLQNTLKNYDNLNAFNRLSQQADEMAEKFKYLDNDDLNEVFNRILTYGKLTEDQMKQLLPVIVDFAAKEKVSVVDASETLIKALEGNGKALKVYGVDLKETADGMETVSTPAERLNILMTQLKPRVEGAALAFGASFPGMLASLEQGFKNLQESIGRFIVELSGVEEQQFKNAVAAKKEADEGERLVSEYEKLSKKVNQTSDDKKRLNEITTDLVAIFGNSVVEIDKETNALKLNIDATRDLIRQKLLLSNQEASSLALKFDAADQGLKKNTDELTKSQLAYNAAVEKTGITMDDVARKMTPAAGQRGDFQKFHLTPDEKQILKLSQNITRYSDLIAEYANDRAEALAKLEELGYKEADLAKLFGGEKPITPVGNANAGKTPANAGKTPAKDHRIDNEKNLTTEYLHQYQLRKEAQMELEREVYTDELESYENRKNALHRYLGYQHDSTMAALLIEKEQTKYERDNLKREQNETSKSFLGRKQVLSERIKTIEEKEEIEITGFKKRSIDEWKKLDESYIDHRLGLMQQFDDQLKANQGVELNNEKIRYEKGLIDEETYKKNIQAIGEKYQLAELLANREFLMQLKRDAEALGIDTKKIDAALQSNQTAINSNPSSKKTTTNAIGLTDKEWQEAQQIGNAMIDLQNEISKAIDARYQREIANLERKKQLIDENYSAEVSAIQGSFQSQQKKDAAIAQLKAQQALQDKALDEEIVRRKRKQAQADKVAAISSAIQKGAVAVVNALDTKPIWLGIVLAGLVGATVAAQVATAASTPLPQYAEGTDFHPGGDAIVGEANKPEYIIRPGAKNAQMVNRATKMNLPRGTRVIPEHKMLKEAQDIAPDGSWTHAAMYMGMDGAVVSEVSGLRGDIGDLKNAIINKRETHFHWSNGELRKSVKNGNSWAHYIDSNFN